MGLRRGDPHDIQNVMREAFRRIRLLEDATSRRILPNGYEVSSNISGDLIISRISDGMTATINFV